MSKQPAIKISVAECGHIDSGEWEIFAHKHNGSFKYAATLRINDHLICYAFSPEVPKFDDNFLLFGNTQILIDRDDLIQRVVQFIADTADYVRAPA